MLEEAGIWRQVQRLAGSGTGAIIATLLAVGYNSRGVEKMLIHEINQAFAGQFFS